MPPTLDALKLNTFLFHHTFGKTLKGHDTNLFAIKPCSNRITCLVTNLKLYVHLADLMGIQLRHGYLIRVTDNGGRISTNPFLGSTVASRLTKHLTTLNIHACETMHSFCSGCDITLFSVGCFSHNAVGIFPVIQPLQILECHFYPCSHTL